MVGPDADTGRANDCTPWLFREDCISMTGHWTSPAGLTGVSIGTVNDDAGYVPEGAIESI